MILTPKEKAAELVKKMYAVHSNSASDITLHFAKQCAMIAVDEIIASNPMLPSNLNWLEVKKEIEKL
jgi:hypothetical protein